MGKLGCTCGNRIIDQADNLPYKGDIIPDKEYLGLFARLVDIIRSLSEANKTGEKESCIKTHFQSPSYPRDLKDEQMIIDLFTDHYFEVMRTIYQCEKCGRIWIQKGQSESFVSFNPDNEDWKNILS